MDKKGRLGKSAGVFAYAKKNLFLFVAFCAAILAGCAHHDKYDVVRRPFAYFRLPCDTIIKIFYDSFFCH
jgi:hypothetical protein